VRPGKAEELTWKIFRDTLIEQAEQGVDYFTIHAVCGFAFTFPMTAKRTTGLSVVAVNLWRSGVFAHHEESFLYTRFPARFARSWAAYDVFVFSLGDGLRSRLDCRRQMDEAPVCRTRKPWRA